jgi:hypothetical protein
MWTDATSRSATRAYAKLTGTDFALPRFLVLDDCADYATTHPDVVELKHAACWLSLQDRQPVSGAPDAKVPVDVPIGNLLTVDALRTLMMPTGSARAGARC